MVVAASPDGEIEQPAHGVPCFPGTGPCQPRPHSRGIGILIDRRIFTFQAAREAQRLLAVKPPSYPTPPVSVRIGLRKNLVIRADISRVREHLEEGIVLQLVDTLADPIRS